jgi:hypothetical protein
MGTLKGILKYMSKDTQPAAIVGVFFILVLIIVAIDSILSLGVQVPKSPVNAVDYWIERYQSLIAGALAISAGYFTVYSARLQINHSEKNRKTEIELRNSLNIVRLIENLYFIRKYISSIRANYNYDSANSGSGPMATFDRDLIRDTISQQTYELPPEIKLRTMYFPFAISVFDSINQKIYSKSTQKDQQLALAKIRYDLLSTMALSSEIQIYHAKYMLSMTNNEYYYSIIKHIDRDSLVVFAEKWSVNPVLANNLIAELGISVVE